MTQRDHVNNVQATDRIHHTSPPYTFPDEEMTVTKQVPAVYVKGSTVSVVCSFTNDVSNVTFSGTVYMDAAYMDVVYLGTPAGTTYNLNPGSFSQAITIAPLGTTNVTINLGTLPDYVACGRLYARIWLVGNIGPNPGYSWGSPSTYSPLEFLYVIKGDSLGAMGVPWTEVLDDACRMSVFQDTDTECAAACTYYLFWNQIFAYNLGTPGVPTVYIYDSTPWGMNLSDFFLDRRGVGYEYYGTSNYVDGDCIDVSFYNQLMLSALGISSGCRQMFCIVSNSPVDFVTNQIVPMGSDATDPDLYIRVPFSLHQQTYLGSNAYDAALAFKYDLSGSLYNDPAQGWPVAGYGQTFVSSTTLPGAYGLCFRRQVSSDTFGSYSPPYNSLVQVLTGFSQLAQQETMTYTSLAEIEEVQ